jgi:hypothetical protein
MEKYWHNQILWQSSVSEGTDRLAIGSAYMRSHSADFAKGLFVRIITPS